MPVLILMRELVNLMTSFYYFKDNDGALGAPRHVLDFGYKNNAISWISSMFLVVSHSLLSI